MVKKIFHWFFVFLWKKEESIELNLISVRQNRTMQGGIFMTKIILTEEFRNQDIKSRNENLKKYILSMMKYKKQ